MQSGFFFSEMVIHRRIFEIGQAQLLNVQCIDVAFFPFSNISPVKEVGVTDVLNNDLLC